MDPHAAQYLPVIDADPNFPKLVGEWEEKNPGSKELHEFEIQVGFPAKDGKTTKWQPCTIVRFGKPLLNYDKMGNFRFPTIPGIDGSPVDEPRVKEVGGGHQLTSELTIPTVQFKSDLPNDAPKPGKSDAVVSGPVTQHEAIESMQLDMGVKDPKKKSYLSPAMAVTPDGNFLYLFGREHVLLKIDLRTFKVVATLQFPKSADSIEISKTDLVVRTNYPSQLWQLDSKTLAVRKIYITKEIPAIGVSPASNLCFLITKDRQTPSPIYHLHMLDLEKGKLLHSLHLHRESFRLPDDLPFQTLAFENQYDKLVFTDDGKYLFMCSRHDTMRLLVDKTDLIYQEKCNKKGGSMRAIAINGDGTQIAAHYGRSPLFIADGLNLNNFDLSPIELKLNTSIRSCDFKAGNLIELGGSELLVTSKTGAPIAKATIHGTPNPSFMLVFPQGDRFITYSSDNYQLYDLKAGRLRTK